MKKLVPALAFAFLGALGVGSAAQASVIDFSAVALCPAGCTGISYTGVNLGLSTALDLDGSSWVVSLVQGGDASGLHALNPITITPTAATYGAVSGAVDVTLGTPIVKTWEGDFGPFTETLTTLTEVVRGVNQIGFVLTGTVTGGSFVGRSRHDDLQPHPVWRTGQRCFRFADQLGGQHGSRALDMGHAGARFRRPRLCGGSPELEG